MFGDPVEGRRLEQVNTREAWERLYVLGNDLTSIADRDPEQEVRGMAIPVIDAVVQAGPWLRQAPSSEHYTIFLGWRTTSDVAKGFNPAVVYVYPPKTERPKAFDKRHNFDFGDPCASYAADAPTDAS
jgi:hypothetical protein